MTLPFRGGLSGPTLGALLCLLAPGLVGAQGWSLDVHAGRVTHETLPISDQSTNAVLGLGYSLDRRSFRVAAGLPLDSEGLIWSAASLEDRLSWSRGRLELGVDALGQTHLHQDSREDVDGWGARGRLLPMVSVSSGPVLVEARTGGSFYRSTLAGETWTRNLHESDLRILSFPASSARISAEVRHLRGAAEERYTFAGTSASLVLAPGVVWGAVGAWISGLPEGAPSVGWEIGGSHPLPVAGGARVWASARQEAFDPTFLTGRRTSWGVGVSYPLGGSPRGRPTAGPEERREGSVVLRLPLSDAPSRPLVAGDFTSWEPLSMTRRDGHWRLELELEPGVYHYAFRTPDGEWFVPESVPNRRDDGMGGWVAVLIVQGDGP